MANVEAQNTHSLGTADPWVGLTRANIFQYDLAILAVLIVLGFEFANNPDIWWLPAWKHHHVQIAAAWFGALGGLMISLKGVYDHSTGTGGWDDSYNLWHLGRPFSGAVAGVVTVFLLAIAGTGPTTATLNPYVVYVAAFVFGTQERRFFNFLYEVAQLVVQVNDDEKKGALAIAEVTPLTGGAGTVVLLKGQAIDKSAKASIGSKNGLSMSVASDGTSAAVVVPALDASEATAEIIVQNPDGASYAFPEAFSYVSATPPAGDPVVTDPPGSIEAEK